MTMTSFLRNKDKMTVNDGDHIEDDKNINYTDSIENVMASIFDMKQTKMCSIDMNIFLNKLYSCFVV